MFQQILLTLCLWRTRFLLSFSTQGCIPIHILFLVRVKFYPSHWHKGFLHFWFLLPENNFSSRSTKLAQNSNCFSSPGFEQAQKVFVANVSFRLIRTETSILAWMCSLIPVLLHRCRAGRRLHALNFWNNDEMVHLLLIVILKPHFVWN